jgi:hypothetical protein
MSTHDRQGQQGRIISPPGQSEGYVSCPVCRQNPVVYNGNYFCDGWVFPGPADPDMGECQWALAHPATTEIDKKFCDLMGMGYE